MSRVSFGAGVALATTLIGPLVAFVFLLSDARGMGSIGAWIISIPVMFVFGVLVGGFISCIPNIVGAALLGWAGTRIRAARHPLVWAVTGAVAGMALGTLDTGLLLGRHNVAMALIGAASALMCRWGTDWSD